MAWPAAIGSGLFLSPHLSGRSGPWEYNGNLYGVFNDTTNGHLEVWKSTDGGQTWVEIDSANHLSGADGRFDSTFVGSTIHIAYGDGTGTHNASYASFGCATDTWGTATATGSTAVLDASVAQYAYGITVTTDGDIFVFYSGSYSNMGAKDAVYYRKSGDGGTNWGGAVQFSPALANHYHFRGAVEGLSNVVHVFMWSESLTGTFERHLTSADALSTVSATQSSVTATLGYYASPPSRTVRSGSTVVGSIITANSGGQYAPRWMEIPSANSTSAPTVTLRTIGANTANMGTGKVGGSAGDGTTTYTIWPDEDVDRVLRANDDGAGSFSGVATQWMTPSAGTKVDLQRITVAGGDVGAFYYDGAATYFDGYPALSLGPTDITIAAPAAIGTGQTIAAVLRGTWVVPAPSSAGQTVAAILRMTAPASSGISSGQAPAPLAIYPLLIAAPPSIGTGVAPTAVLAVLMPASGGLSSGSSLAAILRGTWPTTPGLGTGQAPVPLVIVPILVAAPPGIGTGSSLAAILRMTAPAAAGAGTGNSLAPILRGTWPVPAPSSAGQTIAAVLRMAFPAPPAQGTGNAISPLLGALLAAPGPLGTGSSLAAALSGVWIAPFAGSTGSAPAATPIIEEPGNITITAPPGLSSGDSLAAVLRFLFSAPSPGGSGIAPAPILHGSWPVPSPNGSGVSPAAVLRMTIPAPSPNGNGIAPAPVLHGSWPVPSANGNGQFQAPVLLLGVLVPSPNGSSLAIAPILRGTWGAPAPSSTGTAPPADPIIPGEDITVLVPPSLGSGVAPSPGLFMIRLAPGSLATGVAPAPSLQGTWETPGAYGIGEVPLAQLSLSTPVPAAWASGEAIDPGLELLVLVPAADAIGEFPLALFYQGTLILFFPIFEGEASRGPRSAASGGALSGKALQSATSGRAPRGPRGE